MSKPKHLVETILSYAAGILYGVALWCWIDATVYGARTNLAELPRVVHVTWYEWIPIVVGTIALFLVNLPPHQGIFGDPAMDLSGGSYTARIRIWLLGSFVVSFGAIVAAVWLAIAILLKNTTRKWPGVSLIVSNMLVFCSALVYRLQRAFEEQDDSI